MSATPSQVNLPFDSAAKSDPTSLRVSVSVAVLIAANLYPIYGVLFDGWRVLDVFLVYWAENVVIGLLTVAAMGIASVAAGGPWGLLGALPLQSFFCVHYGMFALCHGVLIYALFGHGAFPHGSIRPEYWPALYEPFFFGHALFYPALSILIARVHAFLSEFVATGAFRTESPGTLMFRPYGRVVVLHLVLLVGGFVAQQFASRVAPLVILALIKIAIDVVPRLRRQ
jgi:hypothetical protein